MTLLANYPLRLPPRSFDGPDQMTVILPIVLIPVTADTLPTGEGTWTGKLVGGYDRYAWPIAWTPPMMARWREVAVVQWLTDYAKTSPNNYLGKTFGPVTVPRAVLYSRFGALPATQAAVESAIVSGIQSLAADLARLNVVAARGLEWDRSFGDGLMACRFPMSGIEGFFEFEPASGFTVIGALPTYEPTHWLAGEVLYISVSYSDGTDSPFATGATGTVHALPQTRAAEADLWRSAHPRHARVKHHNIYVQEASGQPDPFDAERIASTQEFVESLAGYDVTLDVYEGNINDHMGSITSSVRGAIEGFFGL